MLTVKIKLRVFYGWLLHVWIKYRIVTHVCPFQRGRFFLPIAACWRSYQRL